jgi:hydroxymethylbilane synthase
LPFPLKVAARSSNLSKAQCQEVLDALKKNYLNAAFTPIFRETTGDLDQHVSLRHLEKTDFFTKELDTLVMEGAARIAIHSAKDLPEPLRDGLQIIALTECVNSQDVLLLKEGLDIEKLDMTHTIATSSLQREARVKLLAPHVQFQDLRGTIEKRIALLEKGAVDGIVVAKAALIRLHISWHNAYVLPGATTPHQGQIAIISKEGDQEIFDLFKPLDRRKVALHTGIKIKNTSLEYRYLPFPLISLEPLPLSEEEILACQRATHILFTSPSSVEIFFKQIELQKIFHKKFIAIGEGTQKALVSLNITTSLKPKIATQEGLVEFFENFTDTIFWPHSLESRPLLENFFQKKGITYKSVIAYKPLSIKKETKPPLTEIDALYFTSPSQVRSYKEQFGALPTDKILLSIGPITAKEICKN